MTLDAVDKTPDTLAELVRYLCTTSAEAPGRSELHAINRGARGAEDPDAVRQALMDLPIDGHTFESTYQRERGHQISSLRALRHSALASSDGMRPEARGFSGLLLATLCGLEISEVQRQHHRDSETTADERALLKGHAATIRALFTDDDVRAQLIDVYFPEQDPWWTGKLERETLSFWRAGTTSAIFSVARCTEGDADSNAAKDYALKIVWPPFLRISEIAAATSTYAHLYRVPAQLAADTPALVPVHASGPGWVIMDFVSGQTLDEYLTDRRQDVAARESHSLVGDAWRRLGDPEEAVEASTAASGGVDLVTMQSVARGLCNAMIESQRAARISGTRPDYHGDLTPANVIVRPGKPDELVLIDFGVNHLFTRTASVGDEAKASFIAPEARKNGPVAKSDLFSLGQILIDAGAQRVDGRGIVPDRFYESYPSIAELLEDLLDADPAHRLAGSDGGVDYLALQARLQFEFDVAARMGEASSRQASSLGAVLWELRAPFNGEPWRQLRTYAAIRAWPQRGRADRLLAYSTGARPTTASARASRLEKVRQTVGRYVDARRDNVLYLRGWSIAAAAASFVSLFFSFWWFFREVPFDLLPSWLRLVDEVVDAPQYLYAYLDRLTLTPPGSGSTRDHLTIRLGVLSYALLHAKLYQAVYARMRPVPATSVKGSATAARAAEVWMRVLPFLGAFLVLWVTLRNVDDWIWAIVIGQSATYLGNLAAYRYVRGALAAGALKLNTVPLLYDQIAGYDSVRSWVRGSLFEAAVCWSVGILIFLDALKDVWLYASMIAALNIFLLYLVKCGLDAPEIRVALHRASFSASRLTVRSGAQAPQDRRPKRSQRHSP